MTPCLESTRTPNQERPRISINGKIDYEYRVVWEQAYGPIPDGLFICHHCDNPRCIRLDHLFLGTQADNIADMMAKGRHVPTARREVCVKGHALEGDNLCVDRRGWRTCRECRRVQARESWRRRHA